MAERTEWIAQAAWTEDGRAVAVTRVATSETELRAQVSSIRTRYGGFDDFTIDACKLTENEHGEVRRESLMQRGPLDSEASKHALAELRAALRERGYDSPALDT